MNIRPVERTCDPVVNLQIDLLDERGRPRLHHRSHNVFLDNGRQFLAEVITAHTFTPGPNQTEDAANRYSGAVVRYMGFGIGGNRQSSSSAFAAPLSDTYDAPGTGRYGGTNNQDDVSLTTARLERPVLISNNPNPVWLKELTLVPYADQFPDAKSVAFVTTFGRNEINLGGPETAMIPLSEIGLFTSLADPSNPNGDLSVSPVYPGLTTAMIAYDTFDPIPKTGMFDIQVTWTLRF